MLSSVILGFVSVVAAQQYTKSPTAPAPAGCTDTYAGSFEVGITQLDAASKLKRQSQPSIANALVITLIDGVLTDNTGRNGYIAANDQFQFDADGGQAGTKYNSGFSVCANNTLALGGSAIWWECLSGDFYNIYDADWAPQCKAAYLNVATYTGTKSASATGTAAAAQSSAASAQTDIASTSATATGSASVSVSTSVIVSTSSNAGVSSITDGQIQGPTTTSSIVITSTTSSLTTITPTPSSTTTVGPVLTSITDHQIQAPTSTASVTPYTGAAAMPTAAAGFLLAAAGAAVALL